MASPREFWLSGAFILRCGTGHPVEARIFWLPVYRLDAAVEVTTALVSWATVPALIPVAPNLPTLPRLADVNAASHDRRSGHALGADLPHPLRGAAAKLSSALSALRAAW